MMLACLDRDLGTLTSVRAQGRFGVNALAAGQAELARRFSGKDPEPEKWAGSSGPSASGLPRLADVLLWVACELRDLIDGGDHLILTGNVLDAESRGRPAAALPPRRLSGPAGGVLGPQDAACGPCRERRPPRPELEPVRRGRRERAIDPQDPLATTLPLPVA